MKRWVHYFDRKVIALVLRLPDWVRSVMLFFTLLGQPPITVGFAAGVIGYGIAAGNSLYINGGAIAIATFAISSLMKLYLRRARPDNEYVRNMIFHTYSFPSGHAAGSLASFGLLAIIISHASPLFAMAVWSIVIVACFAIGVSRVYLGAHYPSDVVGGWIVGAIGLVAILAEGFAA